MLPPWTASDYDQLVTLSRAQSPPIDPAEAAAVLWEEGGMNPRSDPHGGSGASGMNGMSIDNLNSLGIPKSQWLAMSVTEQLNVIFKLWEGWAQRFNGGRFPSDAGELLALNFLPGAFSNVHAGDNPSAVLAGVHGPYADLYAANAPLQNAAGEISVNSLRAYIQGVATRAGSTWANIKLQIHAAILRVGDPVASGNGFGTTGGGAVVLLLVAGTAIWIATRSA